MDNIIEPGAWVCVTLRDHCDIGPRPHRPDEDGTRGQVSVMNGPGDHCIFVRFNGQHRPSRFPPEQPWQGGTGLGRHYRPDELEVIPPP